MMRQHTSPWLGWSVALLLAVGCGLLGVWQLQRMQAKQALLDQAGRAATQAVSLRAALAAPGRVHGVDDRGEALPGLVLLDNQIHDGRAGLRVYQRVRSVDGSVVLADLGWLPMPADRQVPQVQELRGAVTLRGLLAPAPAIGLAMGPALHVLPAPGRWLAQRLDPAALEQAFGMPLPAPVLRLDPALPLGYARDLELLPNTLPPQRHLGYAVQWFGLAIAVLVCAAVVHWRRRGRGR